MARQFKRIPALVLLAVGLAGLAGCGATAGSPSAPSASAVTSVDTASHHFLAGQFGFFGTSAWMVSDSGLSVSQDGGQHWSAQTLPDGVTLASVAAVSQAPNRRLWMAVPDSDGVHLYSRPPAAAAAWSNVLLAPSWPAEAAQSGPPSVVTITPGPGGIVTVAATVAGASTATDTAFSSLFISTDDGETFVQHPASSGSVANVAWQHIAFVTPQSGFVVAATSADVLLHTSDGGTTWSTTSVKGLPPTGSFYFGTPAISGSDVQLPLISLAAASGSGSPDATFSLLISHDGGATFDGPTGPALDLGVYARPVFDSIGQVTWVAPNAGGMVYETTDGGRTWTTVKATGVPSGVSSLTLTSPTSATALIGVTGCPGFVAGCWSRSYLVATTDGGRTWSEP